MNEAKAKQYEDIYRQYVLEHKTARQIAAELNITPKTVFNALKKMSHVLIGIDNKDDVKFAYDTIKQRIQKLQQRIDSGELKARDEILFYGEIRKCERNALELKGLLKNAQIDIKDSNVLIAHNVPGMQKAINEGRRKAIEQGR